jgi:DNA-binding MarR family transcriptional regulator
LLGALLRLSRQEIVSHLELGLRALGAPPFQDAVLQPLYQHPEGLRITELARIAGVTKQSIAEMVDAMEAAGYVERLADPSDGRARLVRLTRRGKAVNKRARELVRQVEARWAERIGAARIKALRETLAAIVSGQKGQRPDEPDEPAASPGSRSKRRARRVSRVRQRSS